MSLTVADTDSGSATLVYNFSIIEVPYRGIQYSTFSNSDQSACSLARSTGQDQYYYNTSANGNLSPGGTFLANLEVGDFIYEDDDLQPTSRVIPPSASSTWLSLEETSQSTVKALQLNASTGAIESILNCTTGGGAAWEITGVNYNSQVTGYCTGDYQTGGVWQNVDANANLAAVVAAGVDPQNSNPGQLFPDEYYSNLYAGQTAPAGYVLAEGAYSDANMGANEYYLWLSLIHI